MQILSGKELSVSLKEKLKANVAETFLDKPVYLAIIYL